MTEYKLVVVGGKNKYYQTDETDGVWLTVVPKFLKLSFKFKYQLGLGLTFTDLALTLNFNAIAIQLSYG